MEPNRINKKIRNTFFFHAIYGLLYPAVLGTVFFNVINFLFFKESVNEITPFSMISTVLLIWYFIIDLYVGTDNFSDRKKKYDYRYLFCDLIIILTIILVYYSLWVLPNADCLLYISLCVICVTLVLLDCFDQYDFRKHYKIINPYNLILIAIGLISIIMGLLSYYFINSCFYIILKYVFIISIGMIIVRFTYYILSDKSYEVE